MPAKSNTSPLADELLIDAEPMEPRALHRGREALWLLLALILVAINLRPALSSLAPVLRQVQTSLDLNSTAAGLLTTLPVLCLGLFAPLATRLAQRHGTERIVLRALLFLACGILLRGLFGSIGLFAGTLMAGAASWRGSTRRGHPLRATAGCLRGREVRGDQRRYRRGLGVRGRQHRRHRRTAARHCEA